jgi:hypothetical protein
MKIAISTRFSYGLSDAAIRLLAKKKGVTLYPEIQDYDYVEYWTVPEDKRLRLPATPTNQQLDEYTAYRKANAFNYLVPRNDKDLIEVIEELGSEVAGDEHAALHIVEILDGVDWFIECNDEFGNEWVAERHRTWTYDPTEPLNTRTHD